MISDAMLHDSAIWIYIYTILISLYLFLLFISEWMRLRSASLVFIFLATMFLGLAILAFGTFYARFLMHISIPLRDEFITSWIWTGRYIIVNIVLTLCAIYFTIRTIRRRNGKVV